MVEGLKLVHLYHTIYMIVCCTKFQNLKPQSLSRFPGELFGNLSVKHFRPAVTFLCQLSKILTNQRLKVAIRFLAPLVTLSDRLEKSAIIYDAPWVTKSPDPKSKIDFRVRDFSGKPCSGN